MQHKREYRIQVNKPEPVPLKQQAVLHDLTSALTIVQLNLDFIQQNLDPESQHSVDQFLQRALAGVDQMHRTIVTARQEVSGPLPEVCFSAVDELQKILSSLQSHFDNASIRVETDYQEDKLFTLALDQFQAIIRNIFINAVQALAPFAGERLIMVKTMRSVKAFTISIYDSGPGMDEHTIKAIFKGGFTTKQGGHGLGIVTAANYMQTFKGSLSCISKVNSGTKFLLRFPWLPK